jgi:hypothetical protein
MQTLLGVEKIKGEKEKYSLGMNLAISPGNGLISDP